jgi:acetyl-CoA synthetase
VEHQAVDEAAVVPQPDTTKMAVPKAHVVAAESWAPSAGTALSVMAHVTSRRMDHGARA